MADPDHDMTFDGAGVPSAGAPSLVRRTAPATGRPEGEFGTATGRQLDHTAANAAIYMLQVTQQHHVQISVMADVKASILITATSLILTAAVTFADGTLRPGLLALMIGSTLSLLGALVAVLPAPYDTRGAPQPGTKGFNLLFFGHFTQLAEDEFVEEVLSTIDDVEQVFATQARDIHSLGMFLQRSKFRPLRFAYLAFLGGVAAAATAEVAAALTG